MAANIMLKYQSFAEQKINDLKQRIQTLEKEVEQPYIKNK